MIYDIIGDINGHADKLENLLLNLKNNAFIHEVSGKLYYFLIFLASFFYTYIYYSRSELSTVKKLMGYLSNISLATKAGKALVKLPAVDSAARSFRSISLPAVVLNCRSAPAAISIVSRLSPSR